MNEQLLSEGLTLMFLGMGFVFCFLIFLVFMTQLMSKIAIRLDKPEPVVQSPRSNVVTQSSAPNQDELLAVMTVAVHRYRHTHTQHH